MRTFWTGLWKEWRDHRLVAVAVGAALPVLMGAAAWGFGDQVPPGSFGGLALIALPVAQALFVLAVASEAFGGERRRGTLDLLRRLPAGLSRAFAAKLGAYVLGTALALTWATAVGLLACRLLGPSRAAGDFLAALAAFDPLSLLLCGGLFALGLWILFLSNVVPQGGAASVGAALLLSLLGLPVYLALKDRPWLVPAPTTGLVATLFGALCATALLACAFAFLRGNRRLSSLWAPAWRGLALVGVIAGSGYAFGAVALQRALTIDPHDPEFRIADHAYLGAGGRYLYLDVYRGPNPWHPSVVSSSPMGTPLQPWIVDLRDGSWRVAGEYDQSWAPGAWNAAHQPQPIVRRMDHRREECGWFDGATGGLRKVLPWDVRTPDVQAWVRSTMPALAWHHDAQGRALWLEQGRLLREGQDAPLPTWSKGTLESWADPVEGGWAWVAMLAEPEGTHTRLRNRYEAVDADSGEHRALERGDGSYSELLLSTRTVLRRPFARAPRSRRSPPPTWELVDLVHGGATQPAVNPPAAEALVGALSGERVLVMLGADRDHLTLSIWNPRTGESEPVRDEEGRPILGLNAYSLATAPGGLRVVRVTEDRKPWPAASTLLLDERAGHAWRLPCRDVGLEVVAIEGPRSVVAIHRGTQVLRFSLVKPAGAAHEVFGVERLFPR